MELETLKKFDNAYGTHIGFLTWASQEPLHFYVGTLTGQYILYFLL